MGSSPLTRGKLFLHELSAGEVGLIPAHAGKTATTTVGMRRAGGSSPLTRGKLLRGDLLIGGDRLIPAHAGKT